MPQPPCQFRTNKRQVVFTDDMSHCLLQGDREGKWRNLCSLPEHPTEIYFSCSAQGVRRLAVTAFLPRDPKTLSVPISAASLDGLITDYFHSAASLEQVAEITLCRRTLGGRAA